MKPDRFKYVLTTLILVVTVVWLATFSAPSDNLEIIACDVGQGDAFLITHKSDQILVDGGPGEKVVECLDKHLPFWDRNIELVVLSHPQSDHFGGLIEVFQKYNVETFLTSGLDASSQSFSLLKSMVGGSSTDVVNVSSGQDVGIGLIHLDILHPSREFVAMNGVKEVQEEEVGEKEEVLGSFTYNNDANDFSVVVLLSYRNFDALFTGDIDPKISNEVADDLLSRDITNIEYLKVPHHGSKNGLSEKLLDVVGPDVAVISVGKNNRYNHPSQEVIDMLNNEGAKILRTDEMGEVVVETDGETVWVK